MTKIFARLAMIVMISFGLANFASAGNVKASFVGESNHVTTGDATIEKQADGSYIVTLAENFSLDGAPDPSVGLGKNGKYDRATFVGENLKSNKGKQSFKLPAGINPHDYNEIYIWCTKFSVSLGVAKY